MTSTRWRATLAIAAMGLGCNSGQIGDTGPRADVDKVVVSPSPATVTLNAQSTLQAVAQDAAGTAVATAPLIWSVKDPNIASVTQSGVVTGLAVGTTQVSASSQGKSGVATVVVQAIPVASVVVLPSKVDAVVGSTTQLTASTFDAGQNALAGRPVTWSSSNTGVATVSGSGVVTGVAAGTATVTATSETKSAAITVTIAQGAVRSVVVTPNPVSMVVGQSTQLASSARDANNIVVTGRTAIWSSSNTAVANVNAQGVVTAVGAGTTSITATVDGVSGTSSIAVGRVPVASVAVSPQAPTVTVTGSLQLNPLVKDEKGATVNDREVTWASSNTAIVTVSGTGVVTGVAPGNATVTATSEGKSGSTTVTVTLVPVSSVSISGPRNLQAGQNGTFATTLRDANNAVLTNRAVAWSSSNTGVATINQAGVVNALSAGNTTITATSEGQTATATLTVATVPVGTVAIAPASSTLNAGQTANLSTTITNANGQVVQAPVTWSSNNAAVAAVSSSGVVTTAKTGTATITATSGTVSGTATVVVNPGAATTVRISPAGPFFGFSGLKGQLSAVASDSFGNPITTRPFTWTSSDNSVASVNNLGEVTLKKSGVVTLKVTIDGASDTATLTVL